MYPKTYAEIIKRYKLEIMYWDVPGTVVCVDCVLCNVGKLELRWLIM